MSTLLMLVVFLLAILGAEALLSNAGHLCHVVRPPKTQRPKSGSEARYLGLRPPRSSALHAGFGAPKEDTATQAAKMIEDAKGKQCPCHSGLSYDECCMPFHNGALIPATATKTVRSRFSALCLQAKYDPSWLIATTHPENKEFIDPERESQRKKWIKALREFANEYEFLDLEFDDEARDSAATISTSSEGTVATVGFKAKMAKATVGDRTPDYLTEMSTFELTGGRWLYKAGDIITNPFKNVKADVPDKKQKFITTNKRGVPKGN